MNMDMKTSIRKFISLNIHPVTRDESIDMACRFVESGQYHYQISLNVAKLVHAQRDTRLAAAINGADVVNADGMPIYVAGRLLSGKPMTRMGGLDYMDGMAEAHPEYRYYFLGAKPHVIEKVCQHYRENYNLNIVGARDGFFPPEHFPEVIKEINDAGTDVLFIALGTPAKEYFLADMRRSLKVKFAVGVGGAFNIIAGEQVRAPQWIQNIGMEWFYRLIQEPRRMWKRYLVTNSLFFYYLGKWMIRRMLIWVARILP